MRSSGALRWLSCSRSSSSSTANKKSGTTCTAPASIGLASGVAGLRIQRGDFVQGILQRLPRQCPSPFESGCSAFLEKASKCCSKISRAMRWDSLASQLVFLRGEPLSNLRFNCNCKHSRRSRAPTPAGSNRWTTSNAASTTDRSTTRPSVKAKSFTMLSKSRRQISLRRPGCR